MSESGDHIAELKARILAMEAIVKATVLVAYGTPKAENYLRFMSALNNHIMLVVNGHIMPEDLRNKAEDHARRLLEEVAEEAEWIDDLPSIGQVGVGS
ncbi:MAG: hypothetical protein ACK4NE_00160 [Albidovulum sp.]